MQHIRRTGFLGVALAALIAITAACGDDDSDAATTPEEPTAREPAEEAAPDRPDIVEITMADYEFLGAPERVPAGTRLTVTNSSEAELHEVVALRLPDEETRSVDELVALPPEESQAAVGGPPVAVLLAEPGGPQIAAVGDGTLAEPGRYVLVCMIPTGADPGAYLEAAAESAGPPQGVEGGPPHILHGMYTELIVD